MIRNNVMQAVLRAYRNQKSEKKSVFLHFILSYTPLFQNKCVFFTHINFKFQICELKDRWKSQKKNVNFQENQKNSKFD